MYYNQNELDKKAYELFASDGKEIIYYEKKYNGMCDDEKTADEMFEDLGYKKIEDNKDYIVYIDETDDKYKSLFLEDFYTITFIKELHAYYKGYNYNLLDRGQQTKTMCGVITMEELKAINKKCAEMMWIE